MPPNRPYPRRAFLDALTQRVLVYDGAMGTSLQTMNLTAEHYGGEQYNGCPDYLNITYPEAPAAVHRSFLEVGVDVIETNTFRSNRLTLGEYGLGERTIEVNQTAARPAPQPRRPPPPRHRLRRAGRHLPRTGRRPHPGRRGRAAHRDLAGHPRS